MIVQFYGTIKPVNDPENGPQAEQTIHVEFRGSPDNWEKLRKSIEEHGYEIR